MLIRFKEKMQEVYSIMTPWPTWYDNLVMWISILGVTAISVRMIFVAGMMETIALEHQPLVSRLVINMIMMCGVVALQSVALSKIIGRAYDANHKTALESALAHSHAALDEYAMIVRQELERQIGRPVAADPISMAAAHVDASVQYDDHLLHKQNNPLRAALDGDMGSLLDMIQEDKDNGYFE